MTVYNFFAGPAMLPPEVVEKAKTLGFNFVNMKISAMEVSHRAPEFMDMLQEMEEDIRSLMNIPDDYAVLFMQGGARTQFAMVPLNLIQDKKVVDYFDTGSWSQAAIIEAQKYAQVNIVSSSQENGYKTIALPTQWKFSTDAAYTHYTTNETINGLQFKEIPDSPAPLVADMSSDILSYPLDVSRFGLIYAASQKNMGPAGLTLVIVKKSLLKEPHPLTPTILNYHTHIASGSLYNTCPTYPWYIVALVMKWLRTQGGVAEIAKRNARKANKLYDFIDTSNFYTNNVDQQYRSHMNVVFNVPTSELTNIFVAQADKAGFYGLLGHPKLGGLRASIYNAMDEAGVDALIGFMADFARKY